MNDELVLRIDGTRPLSAETVAAVVAVCDTAEDLGGPGRVIVHVSGAPRVPGAGGLTVSLVSKWERALRRLERLPSSTVAVAEGDCGGAALEALLTTDYRIATASVRLMVPLAAGATWPGMALYRMARQAARAAAVRRAALFGTPIEAEEALQLHLVDELTDDTANALTTAAERGGALDGPELAIRRQLLIEAHTTSFEEALGVHLAACDRVLRHTSAGTAS